MRLPWHYYAVAKVLWLVSRVMRGDYLLFCLFNSFYYTLLSRYRFGFSFNVNHMDFYIPIRLSWMDWSLRKITLPLNKVTHWDIPTNPVSNNDLPYQAALISWKHLRTGIKGGVHLWPGLPMWALLYNKNRGCFPKVGVLAVFFKVFNLVFQLYSADIPPSVLCVSRLVKCRLERRSTRSELWDFRTLEAQPWCWIFPSRKTSRKEEITAGRFPDHLDPSQPTEKIPRRSPPISKGVQIISANRQRFSKHLRWGYI